VARSSLWTYIKAAFNARPAGFWFPPNWGLVAGAALLGLANPGFWAIGAGLELAYLLGMASSKRYRNIVDGRSLAREQVAWQQKVQRVIMGLSASEREQFASFEQRCRQALAEGPRDDTGVLQSHKADAINRLMWIYLQLLSTRQSLVNVLQGTMAGTRRTDSLDLRLDELNARLQREAMDNSLRQSLQGQAQILKQRIEARNEAKSKLEYLDSELIRMQEQVNLIREQGLLASEPEAAGHQIDAISSSLGETTQWIRAQQRAYGLGGEVYESPPSELLARE